MKPTIRNCNAAQAQQIRDCLKKIKKRLEVGPRPGLIPESKRRKLLERIETSGVFHCGGPECRPRIAAYTDRAGSRNIHICRITFGMRELRLCAVILHEVAHSCGSFELDSEIIENIIYPPDEGGAEKGGGTWPTKATDCPQFCARTRPRTDGLRESDLYIWDPKTGKVWERTSDGNKGPQIWDDPAILAKWRCDCPESEVVTLPPDGPLVDLIEPGSFPEGTPEPTEEEFEEGTAPEGGEGPLTQPVEPGSFPEGVQESGRIIVLIDQLSQQTIMCQKLLTEIAESLKTRISE